MVAKPAALPGLKSGQLADRTLESDELLAARGDADSFVRLYHAHVAAVYRYLLVRLGDRQDAEDVTSAVFERAWHSVRRYHPGSGAFRAWLFAIARHALVDHYRRHVPRSKQTASLTDALPDHRKALEEGALFSERMAELLSRIRRLEPEQQEMLRLRFVAELQYPEIAHILGKRESAVKMTVYRALEEIRRSYPDAKTST